MLEPFRNVLISKRIVLASTSPRRKEILQSIGLPFEVCPSLYEENLDSAKYSKPSEFVMDTAFHKVEEVADRLKSEGSVPDLIIGADTMVAVNKAVIGKPTSKQVACDMLQQLSGRTHTVFTGVVLRTGQKTMQFYEATDVYMTALSPKVIEAYVATGEPMDKAGAYGIQGLGGSLVEKIDGDYFNVMGLPLHKLCKHIYELCETNQI